MKTAYKKIMRAPLTLMRRIRGLNVPARASLFYTGANIFSRASALIFTPFFTRIMSAAEYGEYSLFHTYLAILTALSTLEIGGGVILRSLQKYREDSERVLTASACLCFLAASVIFACFALYRYFSGTAAIFDGDILLLYASVISASVINLFSARCKYFYKYKAYIILTVIGSFVSSLLALMALKLPPFARLDRAALRIAVGVAVSVLCALPIIIYMLKNSAVTRPCAKHGYGEIIRHLLKLAIPMLPYYLSVMLITESDKLIIEDALGKAELAKYSVAYSAAVAISVVGSGLSQVLGAWVMRKSAEDEYGRIRTVLSLALKLLSLTVCAYLCAVPELFGIIAPQSYSGALICIYPVALSVIPVFLSGLCTSLSLARDSCLPAVISGISASLLHGALARLFIPEYGIIAAGVVHLISYLFLLALFIIIFKIRTGKLFINVNKAFQTLLFSALLAFLSYLLVPYIIARIVLAVFCIALAAHALYKSRRLISEKQTGQ